MATVNLTNTATDTMVFPARDYVGPVGVITRKFSVAEALAQKGSAIAASDVFNLIPLPHGSIFLGGSAFVETVSTSGSLDATLDIGWSGAADFIVDGVSVFSSGFCAIGTNGHIGPFITGGVRFDSGSADYIDVKIATLSGTLSDGVVRVSVVLADVGAGNTANTSNV